MALALGVAPSGVQAQVPPDGVIVAPDLDPVSGRAPGAETGLETAAEVPAPILVVNQERLLSQSRYGARIQREVEAAGTALAAENRRIEARLTEEELALTEQRARMTPEEFRPLARDFDARVNAIRAAQEAKSRLLQQQAEAAQARFFDIAFPVLVELLSVRGAAVLMDGRAILLSADGIDITEAAIARIDERVGDGGPEPLIAIDIETVMPVLPPPRDADPALLPAPEASPDAAGGITP